MEEVLKKIASNALETYIERNNIGPYKDSLKLKLGLGSQDYKKHEATFLEEAYRESISASGKVLSSETWQEFSHKLSSNLPRGARCSYITLRNSAHSKRFIYVVFSGGTLASDLSITMSGTLSGM